MVESDTSESSKGSGQEQPRREKEGEDFRVMMVSFMNLSLRLLCAAVCVC